MGAVEQITGQQPAAGGAEAKEDQKEAHHRPHAARAEVFEDYGGSGVEDAAITQAEDRREEEDYPRTWIRREQHSYAYADTHYAEDDAQASGESVGNRAGKDLAGSAGPDRHAERQGGPSCADVLTPQIEHQVLLHRHHGMGSTE